MIWPVSYTHLDVYKRQRWSSMQEIIDTSYIKMITGEEDVDEGFDKMVSDWMAAGGDKVTEEVNAIVAGK